MLNLHQGSTSIQSPLKDQRARARGYDAYIYIVLNAPHACPVLT